MQLLKSLLKNKLFSTSPSTPLRVTAQDDNKKAADLHQPLFCFLYFTTSIFSIK